MSHVMREWWGVAVLQGQPRRVRTDCENVKNLVEICGSELTKAGARKLLEDHRGDCMTALNVFMDMSPSQKARVNEQGSASDDESDLPDVGVISTALPRGWTDFKSDIVSWVKGQCLALGCTVELSSADKTTLPETIPPEAPTRDFDFVKALLALQPDGRGAPGTAARGLSLLEECISPENAPGKLSLPRCPGPDELLGAEKAVHVRLRPGLVDELYKREGKVDSRLKKIEARLLALKNIKGTIDWAGWFRGGGPAETGALRAAKGVVTVRLAGSTESFLIPAAMVSFGEDKEENTAGVRFVPTGASMKDPLCPHVVETACGKVMIFDRVGGRISSVWLRALADTLQNRFLDTQIFFKRTATGYRIAVCGLGGHWVRHWLLGRLMWEINAGHSGLRSDAVDEMEKKTACSILLSPHAPSPRHGPGDPPAQWEWKESSGWRPYSAEVSLRLEEAYGTGTDVANIAIGKSEYEVVFANMIQRNLETKTARAIRRVTHRGGEMSFSGDSSPGEAQNSMGINIYESQLVSMLHGELSGEADDVEGDMPDEEEEDEEDDEAAPNEREARASDDMHEEELQAAIALSRAEDAADEDDAAARPPKDDVGEDRVPSSSTPAPPPHAEAANPDPATPPAHNPPRSPSENFEDDSEVLAVALALSLQDTSGPPDAGASSWPVRPPHLRAAAPIAPLTPAPHDGSAEDEKEGEKDAAEGSPDRHVDPLLGSPEPLDACEDGKMWVAVIGPHNTRRSALELIEREREVREEILRILPSMQGIIHPDEVVERTNCKVVAIEGPGMVRVVGYPKDLQKARAALERLVPLWQRQMQKKRLSEVTKELVCDLSKIEVRVPISDRLRQLLSQPIGMHASGFVKDSSASLYDRYRSRRNERRAETPDDVGRVQVLWVTLDEFAMDIARRMLDHGVPVPKEWTAQGAVMGLYVGDKFRNNALFNATPATRQAVDGFNVPLYEDGTVIKLDSWLNQDAQTQRQGLDVFLRTVDDWLKCTVEQRYTDPGRPSLVVMEVEWEVKPPKAVRGHNGMWRQDGLTVNNYWCSVPSHRDWPYCEHSGSLRVPHWSCCGERRLHSRCTRRSRNSIQPGSKVRVKASVKEPKFKWGLVSPGDVGTVIKVDREGERCTVDFPKSKKWNAWIPDLELAPGNTQKGMLHNPALGFLSRLSPPEQFDKIADEADARRVLARLTLKVVQQKWGLLADQYLLAELNKVLAMSAANDDRLSDLRSAHSTTQRARHRLKEMEKDAEKTSSHLIDRTYEVIRALKRLRARGDEDTASVDSCLKLTESLLETVRDNLKDWLKKISVADFEAERLVQKLRLELQAKELVVRRQRTVWDIIQHISAVSGAFIDYRPPNLHLRVSGYEVNVRTAMQHLRYLGDEGALGLEKSVTVTIPAAVAARLKKNSGVLLQLIQQQAGLHQASIQEGTLELVGTEEQVTKALNFLDLKENVEKDEYAMPLLSHATQDWGRQLSAIPPADPKVCCACLTSEDEQLYELLCGHNVHPTCLQKWVSSCIERSKGITDSGEMEGPGAVAVCPMTGGGGCMHVLTTREFCEAASAPNGGAHMVLDNLERHILKRLPTHDRIRSCPKCEEWIVTGSKVEPIMCVACGHTFCAVRGMPKCGGTAHYFSSCDQFASARIRNLRKRGHEVPAEVENVGEMPENCVPCKRCHSWIMREEDKMSRERCRYMVCRECMYEFCWLCLLPAVNHKHVHPAEAPAEERSKQPECDPENRDERRRTLLEKMQEGEVVSVWKDCSTCSRCNKWPITKKEKAFACLQCPNIYLCEDCEDTGCTADPSHVLDELPRVDPVKGKTFAADKPENVTFDEAVWNEILPKDSRWVCPNCSEETTGDCCAKCGECKASAQPAKTTCSRGHELSISCFAEGAYKDGWICNECNKRATADRWFCSTCKEDYCLSCRPAQPALALCPNGHHLKEDNKNTKRGYCSGPGCPVVFPSPKGRYRCNYCNFDMCATCFKPKPAPSSKKYFICFIGLKNVNWAE